MKKFIFSSFCLLSAFHAFTQNSFIKVYGTSNFDQAVSVALADDDGVIMAGMRDIPGKKWDIGLIRVDKAGKIIWEKNYGGNSDEFGGYIIKTNDGNYVVLGLTWSYYSDSLLCQLFFFKIDPFGNIIWEKYYGGNYLDEAVKITQDSDGGYIILGQSTSFSSDTTWQYYLVKTDSSGNIKWQKTYGTAYYLTPNDMQITLDGGYIISGILVTDVNSDKAGYVVRTNNNGDTVWTRKYDQYTNVGWIEVLPDNTFLLPCRVGSNENLININALGDTVSTVIYQTNKIPIGKYIRPLNNGYISTGTIGGVVQLIKLDATYKKTWQNSFQFKDTVFHNSYAMGVFQSQEKGFYIVGYTEDNDNTFDNNYLLIKTDSLGMLNSVSDTIESPISEVTILPNPAGREFCINIYNFKNSNSTFSLYDITGRVVIVDLNLLTGRNIVSTLPLRDGLYYYRIFSESSSINTGKIIIHNP